MSKWVLALALLAAVAFLGIMVTMVVVYGASGGPVKGIVIAAGFVVGLVWLTTKVRR